MTAIIISKFIVRFCLSKTLKETSGNKIILFSIYSFAGNHLLLVTIFDLQIVKW
jgi:hypothetical protein